MASKVTITNNNNKVTITPQSNTSISTSTTNTPVTVTQGTTSVVQVNTPGPQGIPGTTTLASTDSVELQHITSSGNISSSGQITAESFGDVNTSGFISASSIHIAATAPSSLTINSGEFDNAVNIFSTDERVNVRFSDMDTSDNNTVGIGAEGNNLILRNDIGELEFQVGGSDLRTPVFKLDKSGSIVNLLNITSSGNISASGIYTGDGSGLTNIPASGIVGLNLSQISSGSVTASIAPDKGFEVNTDISASGNISASNISAIDKVYVRSTGNPSNISLNRTDGKQASFIAGLNGTAIRYENTNGGDFSISGMVNPALVTSYPEVTTPEFSITESKVGIGTFTPTEKLHVHGNIIATGSITSSEAIIGDLRILGDKIQPSITDLTYLEIDASDARIQFNIGGSQFFKIDKGSSNSEFVLGTTLGTSSFDFFTKGFSNVTPALKITSNGNVGIGTTNPDEKLEVIGNISASGHIDGNTITSHGTLRYIGSLTGESSGMGTTHTIIAQDEQLQIGGYIGPNPDSVIRIASKNLEIIGPVTASTDISASGNLIGDDLQLGGEVGLISAANLLTIGNTAGGQLNTVYFKTAGVGIGTQNPSAELDVVGDIEVSGDITASGDISGSSSSSTGSFAFGVIRDKLGIGTHQPDYDLDVAGQVGVANYIYHNGDDDTHILMEEDMINLVAGGKSIIKGDEDEGYIRINNTNANLDTQIMADDGEVVFHADAGTNKVGIGTNSPGENLEVVGHISASGTGSFENLKLDYDIMPTSDPSIKGVVYRSSSLGLNNLLFISSGS